MKAELERAKYGDVILFRPTRLSSRLICWLDGGEYSHAAVYLEKRHGRALFVESLTDGGVKLSVLDEHAGNYDIFRPSIEPYQEPRHLLGLVGRRGYDFWRIARIVAYYLFGKRLPADDGSRLICTELVNWVYDGRLVDWELVTPRTVHEAVK